MSTQNADSIEILAFDKWILNLQIMYLVIKELKTDQVALPATTSELGVFVQGCIAVLPTQPALKTFLQQNLLSKNLKKLVKQMVENTASEDSNLQWLFGLELSELGEKLEHWFYNQLLPLQDDILQDTVFLSSLNFFTNLQNKMHKETDFLIISWQKKLIISIELKMNDANEKVFKQLERSHQIFEERLGDQLKISPARFQLIS